MPAGGFQAPPGYPDNTPYQWQQAAPAHGAFPGPGEFPAQAGPADSTAYPAAYPAAYGQAGYPPPGYGPPGFASPYPDGPYQGAPYPSVPYPNASGAPPAHASGAVPRGFAGGTGSGGTRYGPAPGGPFPGQPPVPPGQGYDHGSGPPPPAYGWHAADAFQAPGEGRRPDGQPPYAGQGQAAYAAPGYAAPGYPGGYPGHGAAPGPHGFPAAPGYAEPPSQPGYPRASGFAGPGERAAPPYPQHQSWPPYGGPGGYHGPAGRGETLNGGAYAYVIHEDDPAAPASSQPYAGPAPDHPAGHLAGHPADAGPTRAAGQGQPGGSAGPVRAITAGEAAAATTARPATAAVSGGSIPDVPLEHMYGPDDPAYGPPGPDWYKRAEERAPAAPQADAGEQPTARGPFEPLRPADAGYVPASDAEDGDGQPGDRPESPASETHETQETLEDLGLDTPTDPEAGALGQVRDLYLVAGRISQDSLERHFDQLLDRQRKLISDYFSQPSPPSAAAAPPSFGFDTADSLAGLRGGLRDAERADATGGP